MIMDKASFTRNAVLIVASAFLVYNIYQVITATFFISHFELMAQRLPNVIESKNPQLQVALFLTQELAGSIDAYLRLIAALFAVNFAYLFYRKKPTYLKSLGKALLFESLYFLMFIPVVINHFVGSVISTSVFLNFGTGLSYLLQIIVVCPTLLLVSLKLRKIPSLALALPWILLAASAYVFGLWIKQGFHWMYGILPMLTPTLIETAGSANSLVTLLLAALICTYAYFMAKTGRIKIWLIGSAFTLAGAYYVIYDLIAIYSPIYSAYLLLADAWMAPVCLLGIALLYDYRKTAVHNCSAHQTESS